jgi:hypothetical protein
MYLNRQNATVAARLRKNERTKKEIIAHDVRYVPLWRRTACALRFGGSNESSSL